MNDSEEGLHDGQAQMMLYDHYKHVTSLCLFTLAGGVALSDKAEGRWAIMLIVALVLIGLAALFSFVASGQVVEARLAGKADDHQTLSRKAPGALLSVGIGMLLYIFTRSLSI